VAIGTPVMLLWLRAPARERKHADRTPVAPEPAIGLTLGEALRTRTFWLLYIAFLLTFTMLLGTLMHAYPMLTERGFSPQTATNTLSCMFIGSIIGQLSSGVLMDRLQTPRIALPFFLSALIGVWIVHSAAHTSSLLIGAAMAGIALGAENGFGAYLTSRYFGLRAFGSIFSCTFSANTLAVAVGMYAMGKSYDLVGNYQPMRAVFGVCGLVALVCMLLLGPYAYPVLLQSDRGAAAGAALGIQEKPAAQLE
jgi:MFS family permease